MTRLIEDGAGPLGFVGCCGRDSTPGEAAVAMREHLELSTDWGSRQRFVDRGAALFAESR